MRGAGGCGGPATGGVGTAGRAATGGAGGVTGATTGGATGFSTGAATTAGGGGGTTEGRGGTTMGGAGGVGGATGFSGGATTAGRTGGTAGGGGIAGRGGGAAGVGEVAGAGATGFGGAGGATTGLATMGGGAGVRIGAAAASFFWVMAFSTSPGREMWERSILVLISSSPRKGRAVLAACVCSAEPRMWARTFSASCSSIELECVFFSDTPTSGSASRMALLLTSNSLARSLIRTLLIRPFLSPPQVFIAASRNSRTRTASKMLARAMIIRLFREPSHRQARALVVLLRRFRRSRWRSQP